MKFTQYYLDCLSHASYLIGDETTGRAVVVDPRRDIDEYVRDAEADGFTIELVIETHFHADFLSGHLELAAATGAEIGFSSVAETEFPSRKLGDGERYSLGEVELEFLHTPGHTPGSQCFLVDDRLVAGDTLFLDSCGRTDLPGGDPAELYRSIHDRLDKVPDSAVLYPGHRYSHESHQSMADTRRMNVVFKPSSLEQWMMMFGH